MAWTEEQYSAFLSDRGKAAQEAATPKKSKYRNVRVMVDGEYFDSKREAAEWHALNMRLRVGEISELRRQVAFPLFAPVLHDSACDQQVTAYIADFTYRGPERNPHGDHPLRLHVVDVKGGKETAMFALKRKWLFLQSGIEVEVVR